VLLFINNYRAINAIALAYDHPAGMTSFSLTKSEPIDTVCQAIIRAVGEKIATPAQVIFLIFVLFANLVPHKNQYNFCSNNGQLVLHYFTPE
jgi:hypothetical protein